MVTCSKTIIILSSTNEVKVYFFEGFPKQLACTKSLGPFCKRHVQLKIQLYSTCKTSKCFWLLCIHRGAWAPGTGEDAIFFHPSFHLSFYLIFSSASFPFPRYPSIHLTFFARAANSSTEQEKEEDDRQRKKSVGCNARVHPDSVFLFIRRSLL